MERLAVDRAGVGRRERGKRDCEARHHNNGGRALGSPVHRHLPGGADAIVAAGFDRVLVERILKMVDGNEFKRSQAAPTIRVSNKAFGSGRQMPIAHRWRREPARWQR